MAILIRSIRMTFFAGTVISILSLQAHAAAPSKAEAGLAIRADFSEMVSELNHAKINKLEKRMMRALTGLMYESARQLQAKGLKQEAETILADWADILKNSADPSRPSGLDLGDHEPLMRWLAQTYDRLESHLGKKLCELTYLSDIKVFNFGIPVVFSPRNWDEKEYRLHFVPFSAATAYWTADLTCSAMTSGALSFACGPMARVPRFAMSRWLGGILSDRLYRTVNGRHESGSGVSRRDANAAFDSAEIAVESNAADL